MEPAAALLYLIVGPASVASASPTLTTTTLIAKGPVMAASQPSVRAFRCQRCGKEFSDRKRRFCSERCRNRSCARRERKSNCKWCGGEFTHQRGSQDYCSRKCASVATSPKKPVATCLHCGLWFEAAAGRKMMFCCRRCMDTYRAINADKNQAKPGIYLTCKQCQASFRSPHARRAFCTADCKRLFNNAKNLVRWKTLKAKTKKRAVCLVCSAVFFTAFHNPCYCSPQCSKRAEKRTRNTARNARIRRATIRSGDRINPFAVFARDGWTCQLCHRKVKRGAVAPHPLAPVLDHIVPIVPPDPSQPRGQHTMANVQCAHFLCNSKRSNVGHAQMRLFG